LVDRVGKLHIERHKRLRRSEQVVKKVVETSPAGLGSPSAG
jgi:hypothetical protein